MVNILGNFLILGYKKGTQCLPVYEKKRQSRYRNKPKPKSSKLSFAEAEGVSIIRPLKGVDLELEANLRSSFIQNYPKFEIIFSVASPQDPAIKIVNELRKEFYHVDSRLIIGKGKEKSTVVHMINDELIFFSFSCV